ncbi:TrmB family transcriptional regulator [Patescibacteria group bacterium]|nr:MAG: TrmB family transcriptional regulator [Patescibacteria group bacterium]
MDKSLLKLFENGGFTDKEARVYLALLELSRGTVTEIAKISGLKRSIIYVLLEGLEKRGFVSQLPEAKIETFQPIDPGVIAHKIKTAAQEFFEMLPYLRTMSNKGKRRPKITYQESTEGVWNIFEEISRAPEAFYITSYAKLEKHFPGAFAGWLDDYKKGAYPQKARYLFSGSVEEVAIGKEIKKIGQQMRVWPELRSTSLDLALYGNKLAITSLSDDLFSVLIESEELAESIKPIFELAWKAGKEIK